MTWTQFFEKYGWLIPALLPVVIVCCLLPALIWVAKRRAAGCSAPRPVTTSLVRWCEAALCSAGCGLLLVVFHEQFADHLRNPQSVPELKREIGQRLMYLGVGSLPVIVATAFRWLRLATAGMVLLISFSMIAVGPVYEWPAVEAAVLNSPMPFRIESSPGLPPVDVTINDVPFGTTPVVTTWEEVKERTPIWENSADHRQESDHGTLSWCPMSVHTSGRRSHDSGRDERQLYLRFTLGDLPLVLYDGNSFKWTGFLRKDFASAGARNGSRVFGHITSMSISPHLTLPAWGDEVQFLLHRARLTDYAVDDAWCAAFESYGAIAEIALMALTQDDANLERVTQSLAMRMYPHVAESVTEAEAWRRLLVFIDEKGESGEFQFAGRDGAAARLLAGRISDERLARQIAAELARVPVWGFGNIDMHSAESGQVTLIRMMSSHDRIDGRWLRPHVLEQLAIERDAALDAVAVEPDNPIEIHVVPPLMRQHRVGDGAEKRIGGRAYEQVLMRHYWRQQPPDPNQWEDADHAFGQSINHWLKLLGDLDSPAGREFRIEQAYYFVKLAEEIWEHETFHKSVPESLNFLFREHRRKFPKTKDGQARKSLAEIFWPYFRERKVRFGDARKTLNMQWGYLARMSPDSEPEQFVASFRELQPDWINNSSTEFLDRMPPDQALKVLEALLAENERQAAQPSEKRPAHVYSRERSQLLLGALKVDDPGVADLLLTEFDRPASGFQVQDLANELREGRIAPNIVERLETCKRSEVRKMMADAGLFLTRPVDRQRIDRLSHDPAAEVSQAAESVLRQWSEWSARPLPMRVLPVAGK